MLERDGQSAGERRERLLQHFEVKPETGIKVVFPIPEGEDGASTKLKSTKSTSPTKSTSTPKSTTKSQRANK